MYYSVQYCVNIQSLVKFSRIENLIENKLYTVYCVYRDKLQLLVCTYILYTVMATPGRSKITFQGLRIQILKNRTRI